MKSSFIVPLMSLLLFASSGLVTGRNLQARNGTFATYFSNPIFDGDSPDPAIIRVGNYYWFTFTQWDRIVIYNNVIMYNFWAAREIFRAPPGYTKVWAPEFHVLDGQLYIYFSMSPDAGNNNRNYIMKADDPNNPWGGWSEPVRLMPNWDAWSLSGTVLQHGNGRRYFVWPSIMGGRPFSLWIAEMYSPYDISENAILLRVPQAAWECYDGCSNEAPFFIYNRGVSYLIFSASSTWGPNYCLGMMSIPGDRDPLNTANWWYGPDGCVFYRNDEESVFTTGNAAFTTSPDGTETWMSYHATVDTGLTDRIARLEKIEWNDDGTPRFPRPHGFDSYMEVPSGSPY